MGIHELAEKFEGAVNEFNDVYEADLKRAEDLRRTVADLCDKDSVKFRSLDETLKYAIQLTCRLKYCGYDGYNVNSFLERHFKLEEACDFVEDILGR